jgi:hypothetical protein
MANLDFYATVEDHEMLLTDLFRQGDLRIFESYSAFDCDLREFTQPRQIVDQLQRAERPSHAVLLQMWAPTASSQVEIKRFSVSVSGHAYRHRIAGWGLMQLYLGKETEAQIHVSHFGHFNQRGAEKRSAPLPSPSLNPGTAADWDWDQLQRISRRIQYRIGRRFSEMKVGSRPVLHGAACLMERGYSLVAHAV